MRRENSKKDFQDIHRIEIYASEIGNINILLKILQECWIPQLGSTVDSALIRSNWLYCLAGWFHALTESILCQTFSESLILSRVCFTYSILPCNDKIFLIPNRYHFYHTYRKSFFRQICIWINFLVMKIFEMPLLNRNISEMVEYIAVLVKIALGLDKRFCNFD